MATNEIDVAVVVDVGERAAGAEQARSDTGRLRDIAERAVPVVVIQHVRTEVGDVEVNAIVVVVIGRAGAHAVFAMAKA